MRHLLRAEGLDNHVECDSAGTISMHTGQPPDPRMRAATEGRGIQVSGRARQIQRGDLEKFDLILTMDDENLVNVRQLDSSRKYQANIRPFCEFVTLSTAREVPDPYYGGPRGFEQVLDLLEDGCANLLEQMRKSIVT